MAGPSLSRFSEEVPGSLLKRLTRQFALCLENTGNETSLILGRVYRVVPDARAAKDDLVRIIDESGDDYLFHKTQFAFTDLPHAVRRKILALQKASYHRLGALAPAVLRNPVAAARLARFPSLRIAPTLGTIEPIMGTVGNWQVLSANPLASALFGRTRLAVLTLLFPHPDEALYLREIARLARVGQGAVQRELQRLAHAGILTRTVRGGRAFSQANRDCPIFPELRSLVLKTGGVVEILRAALAPVAGRIRVAFVYGSIAHGRPKPGSDVDLFVIGDVSFGETVQALPQAQPKIARDVNPTVYDEGEFRQRLARKDHFITAVMTDAKLFVIGDEHELERLARERVRRRSRLDTARDRGPVRRRRP